VWREIIDDVLQDHIFYIHAKPTGNDGSGSTASFGPFVLQSPCRSYDVFVTNIEDQTKFVTSGFGTLGQFSSTNSSQCQI
jgi:hypothetical protein